MKRALVSLWSAGPASGTGIRVAAATPGARRPGDRRSYAGIVFLCVVAAATGSVVNLAAQTRTTIHDTLHTADGAAASCQVQIAWPVFTSADGVAIAGGHITRSTAAGVLEVALVPNAGASPAGTSYAASYLCADGTSYAETWVVPLSASPVPIASVRVSVAPSPAVLIGQEQLTQGSGFRDLLDFYRAASATATRAGQCYWNTTANALHCSTGAGRWQSYAPGTAGGMAGGDLAGTYPDPALAASIGGSHTFTGSLTEGPLAASGTDAYGFRILPTTGSPINMYGLKVDDQIVGTTNYNLWSGPPSTELSTAINALFVPYTKNMFAIKGDVAVSTALNGINQSNDVTAGLIIGANGVSSAINSTGAFDNVIGIMGDAIMEGAGTAVWLQGIVGWNFVEAGTVRNSAALYANNTQIDGGTLIGNYGLYVEDQTAGTNNWAIKTGLGKVEFGDAVQINSSVTSHSLVINKTSSDAEGIRINGTLGTGKLLQFNTGGAHPDYDPYFGSHGEFMTGAWVQIGVYWPDDIDERSMLAIRSDIYGPSVLSLTDYQGQWHYSAVDGNHHHVFNIEGDGSLTWGSGNRGAEDAGLERSAAGTLTVTNAGSGLGNLSAGQISAASAVLVNNDGTNHFTLSGTPTGARTLTLPDRSATVGTTTGTLASGHCARFDASGNLVDAGAACGGGFVPTGTGFRHVTGGSEDSAAKLAANADVDAAAAIAESKLALNYATHSNANDPTGDQKAALAGTSGSPSGTNRYVTDGDSRNTNARAPTAHAASHASGGGDAVALAESQITNLTTDLAAKVPATRTVNSHALSSDVTVTAGDVGLGNVTNDAQVKASEKGAASGVATLDTNSKVVQDPANATATPTASKIPISGSGGTLAVGWLPLGTASGTVAPGDDVRFGYSLQVASGALASPPDATTYYCGGSFGFAPVTTAAITRLYVPQAGTITKAYMTVRTYSAAGSSEQWSMWIRLNNTTDTLISSTIDSSGGTTPVFNTALSIAVVAGDYVEIKFTTPTWSTNPGNIYVTGSLWIDQ